MYDTLILSLVHLITVCGGLAHAGVTDMRLMMEKENASNRGFGFVEFFNKSAAEAARKRLSSPDFKIKGHTLNVKWAEAKKSDVNLEQV